MDDTHARARILWVDDHIIRLRAYIKALQDKGFDVTAVEDGAEAVKACTRSAFDVYLIDIRMPGMDGIEVLRRIRAQGAVGRLAVLSSYLYLERYREQLAELDFDVHLIDKDMPNVNAPDFHERFVAPIERMVSGSAETVSTQEERLQEQREVDPFVVPLRDYVQKSIVEKDELVQRAQSLAENTLEAAFAQGAIWVVLCGSPNEVRGSASKIADVWDEDQIMQMARKHKRAPFQFFKSVDSDDFSWSGGAEQTACANYPTVLLDIQGDEVNVHFDTGSPITFFSYEEMVRVGAVRPTTIFGQGARSGRRFFQIPLNISVFVVCQNGGGRRLVQLRGVAVRDWERSPFSRICVTDCEKLREGATTGRLCVDRLGLIGRNVLTENGLRLLLDGRNKKTELRS